MYQNFLSDEEINIAFLGEEIIQEIKNNYQKKKIISRKISIGIFTLFLIL